MTRISRIKCRPEHDQPHFKTSLKSVVCFIRLNSYQCPNPQGRVALMTTRGTPGTRFPLPPQDRALGGRGPLQQRQRTRIRPTNSLHGNPRRLPAQSRHQGSLSKPAGRRTKENSGAHRLPPKVAHYPQRHDSKTTNLASRYRSGLKFKTVVAPARSQIRRAPNNPE